MNRKNLAIFHNLPSGGGLRVLKNIINRYKETYDIDIYVIGEKLPEKIRGVKTIFIKVTPWKNFFLRNLWIFVVLPHIHRKLALKINKKYTNILLTHDYFTKSPYLLRYLSNKKIYFCQEAQREYYESSMIHSPSLREKMANIFRYPIKIIDETNVRMADTIICNSEYSKKVLKSIYSKECEIVYPGVDEKFFKPGRIKKEKMILCVGGINPVKDQLFLVKSLVPLLNKFRLVLVGKGKKDYIQKIRDVSQNNPNLKIVQSVTDNKLKNLYRKAMVTCISAQMEPFGLSSIESQACGTPVVSIDEGGPIESIIVRKTGYLAKRNTSDYMNKVKLAIKNHNSMSKTTRKNILNNWTWDKTLKSLDKYLI